MTEVKDFATNTSLWKLKEVNERGQAKEILLGNGIVKKRTYDQFGNLTKMLDQTTGSSVKTAMNLTYRFNAKRGNLESRSNANFSWNESFTYDSLDRLTDISGAVTRSQKYDARGRISSNSAIGEYNYGGATSYRLQDISLNTQGDAYYQKQQLQKVTYNAFKKPVSISVKDQTKVDFEYGILQGRSHAYYGGKEDQKTDRRFHKHYSAISPVEIVADKQGNTKIITYIGGDAYDAPVVYIKQTASGSDNGYHYVHRDYLGSILAISDANALVKEQRQFGAWGEIDKFKKLQKEADFNNDATLLNRGYTGHEHFTGVALIHMNGRMYDAKLGRFLSPDNYIQEPFSTQSFNRFGYVWNNPLKFTDPSGEIVWFVVAGAAIIGSYAGAAQANGTYNPLNWDWSSSNTWSGFIAGAAAGVAALYTGGAVAGALSAAGASAGTAAALGAAAGGGIQGGVFATMPGGDGNVFKGVGVGIVSGLVGGGAGHYASQYAGDIMINGLKLSTGPAIQGFVGGAVGGAVGGYTGGFAGGYLTTGNLGDAHNAGIQGLGVGIAIGGASGFSQGYHYAKQNSINPWSGKPQLDGVGKNSIPRIESGAAKTSTQLFKSGIFQFKNTGLTNAGRAVTKHPQYFGFKSTEALMKVHNTPAALNKLGSQSLKNILRNGVRTTGAGGRYPNGWVTYTLKNGNAASWTSDGVFIGFRGIR